MSLDFFRIFNLESNYRKEDLENGYNNRVREIMANNNLSSFDKRVLLDNYKEQYRIAYNELLKRRYFPTESLLLPSHNLSNFFRNTLFGLNTLSPDFYLFDSPLSQDDPILQKDPQSQSQSQNQNTIHSSSTIQRERVMPDGSRIVLKETSTNNNGDVTKTTTSYRKLSSGATEPIDYDEGLKQLENRMLI